MTALYRFEWSDSTSAGVVIVPAASKEDAMNHPYVRAHGRDLIYDMAYDPGEVVVITTEQRPVY